MVRMGGITNRAANEYAGVKRAAVEAFTRCDYEVAVELFRQILDATSCGRAEIAYNLGQCLLQLQDYDGARYYLECCDGNSTADINRRTHSLLHRLDELDDTLAVVEPHLAL
jgi:tetratricopeptide (TPR) repeat protein